MRVGRVYIALVIGLLTAAGELCAQQQWKIRNANSKHYFSVSAGCGYYSLLENIPELRTTGGAAGMLNVGYELRYNRFCMMLGVDVQYGASTMYMAPFSAHRDIYDTQGKRVSMHYYVGRYSDTQSSLRVGLPLLFGFYTNSFYGVLGAKFAYVPMTVSIPEMRYTTTGTYEQYIVDFENMPNHFYADYTTPGREEIHMHPQGLVVAEVGYDLLNKERMSSYARCSVLKIALYAEYGLNSCMSGLAHDEQTYEINPADPSQLIVSSYYARRNLRGARIVPFYVGVKLTYLIRIRTANCHCESPW
ncbi:MAG: hypothetical protein J5761_00200 [Paludibacteraceae bacterium]|nr:hypothetical protein [Paludibacteraceae bacterium]